MSTKEVYVEIVDYLIKTTDCLDVICEAFGFPGASNIAGLPSFVPDWSVSSLSHRSIRSEGAGGFDAVLGTKAECRFLDQRSNLLEVSAICIDEISHRGMNVSGVISTKDYLATFLQWRAILLDVIEHWPDRRRSFAEVAFTQTLCLGEGGIPERWRHDPEEWRAVCLHAFASLLEKELPYIGLDKTLRQSLEFKMTTTWEDLSQILYSHVFVWMTGLFFCITEGGCIGAASGAIREGDVVVVALGCTTPIALRPHGRKGHYQFIGDLYLHGYMDGKAVRELKNGQRELKKYVLS